MVTELKAGLGNLPFDECVRPQGSGARHPGERNVGGVPEQGRWAKENPRGHETWTSRKFRGPPALFIDRGEGLWGVIFGEKRNAKAEFGRRGMGKGWLLRP